MRKSLKGPYKYSSQAITNLYNTMQVLKSKRESYSLQLLKQFILFPSDESDSSERTISRYDKLLFNDEALHTMFKKLQTKTIENKIWGFINIRAHRYIEAANKIGHHIKRLKKKVEQQQKIITFYHIKTFAVSKHLTQQIQIKQKQQAPSKPIHKSKERPREIQPIREERPPQKREERPQREVIEYRNEASARQFQQQITSITSINIKQTFQISSRPPNPKMSIVKEESNTRQRSRSGSLVRYEYDLQSSKRILLNGQIIPCTIHVKRSQSPLRAPEYIRLQKNTEGQCEKIRYIGKFQDQLNKVSNRNLQYQTSLSNRHIRQPSPQAARIIYVERSPQKQDNQQNYSHRGQREVSPKGSHKIIRLNSASKTRFSSYLDHLQS